MNSLYTQGVRQTSSIQADLERMRGGDSSPSLIGVFFVLFFFFWRGSVEVEFLIVCMCFFVWVWVGQVSASLAALQRTIDDYDSMAKREIMKTKQEKAQMLVLFYFSVFL